MKKILDDLQRLDDVQACMLAKRHAGIITPEKKIKLKNMTLWKLINDTTDKFFEIANFFYQYGLSKIYFEIGELEIILSLIEPDVGLLVVIPSLANKGLLEVEIENAKRAIAQLKE